MSKALNNVIAWKITCRGDTLWSPWAGTESSPYINIFILHGAPLQGGMVDCLENAIVLFLSLDWGRLVGRHFGQRQDDPDLSGLTLTLSLQGRE